MVQKGTATTRWTTPVLVRVKSQLSLPQGLAPCYTVKRKRWLRVSLYATCHSFQVKALLRALHYQLGLNAFAFSIQDCSSSSGCLQVYRAAFPNNAQGHVFRQILCCFCSSQILFYRCSGMRVFKPSNTHADGVYSVKLVTVLLLSFRCASEMNFSVFLRRTDSRFDIGQSPVMDQTAILPTSTTCCNQLTCNMGNLAKSDNCSLSNIISQPCHKSSDVVLHLHAESAY